MNILLTITLAVFGFLATPPADQKPLTLDDVTRAIGAGNAGELAAVMDAEVELIILDKEDLYSRADATAALKKFFAEVTPKNFGKVHQGASKSADAEYCIGTLATAKGPYRVYVYVAKGASGIVLQELRFERE